MSIRKGGNIIAGLPDVSSKANTDLMNLTSVGKNIANWSSNVTNCITKIPQDIKVGLNNGGLYLKDGCKYCVPNGFEQDGVTPHFDFVTVNADTSPTAYGTGRTGCMAVWSTDHFEWSTLSSFYSGSTQPPSGSWWVWYDTTTNKIKHSNGSTIVDGVSFPICMITENAGTGYDSTVKSIDHVFNGFGQIGATIYALPGVKGLIPNGRNADGTLKNIEFELDSVKTMTNLGSSDFRNCVIYSDLSIGHPMGVIYDSVNNITYQSENGIYDFCIFGGATFSSGEVTSFTPKTAFHALDYNDKENIVSWGMPNYGAAVSKSLANGSISGKGYLLFTTKQNVGTCNITIGSTVFAIGGNYNTLDTLFVPVDNNSYACSDWSIINTLKYIPLKGV